MAEFLLGVAILFLVGLAIGVALQAVSFLFDVPKQLKRIADALERRAKDGK